MVFTFGKNAFSTFAFPVSVKDLCGNKKELCIFRAWFLFGAAHFYFYLEVKTMRKTIALILALSMVFVLCACGDSPNEEDKIVIQNENGEAHVVGNASAADSTLKFEVEDCKLKITDSNNFLYAKVRNLNDFDVDFVVVLYQLLDENGDSLTSTASSRIFVEDLFAGQGGWFHTTIPLENVVTIRFYGFETFAAEEKGKLTEIYEISMEDITIEKG